MSRAASGFFSDDDWVAAGCPNDSTEDCYVPTDEEVQQALEEAEQMWNNMLKYGTIDKPKGCIE